ncbi:putative aminopeptidase P, cytoplasmic [Tilletiaria anomala UBC 951]|uniref:Putative aminopeptidase P, cytoplasmic n=1 Tax=Tilletiaria anomala (strain ATCC 24038 / CBS 436.72 / UBC 951) TaxID=1037660 RepID=A0A066VGV3_TILAU|nr:putative aminopeptidase P, cytoplasmic [Tilletiaria anomala UBC 951]KDN39533.1 putative aminopeptidase P, cytoplasmic [Tilletiaria anomala UBC 951]
MGAIATGVVETKQRVERLRVLMNKHGLNAYVVPSEDAHFSEYPAQRDLRRGYISGFSGSAGCAVVTEKDGLLFTDGRYFLQAGQQLQAGVWTLMKQGEDNVPTWQEFLHKKLPNGSRIGVDPSLITAEDAQALEKELVKKSSKLEAITQNLVDEVWDADGNRPPKPSEPIFALDDKTAGKSYANKAKDLREELKKRGNVQGFVANMLDEVAWLFNLRGSDVPYNPVFFAFALVLLDRTYLYVNEKQLDGSAQAALKGCHDVELRPYDTFYEDLHKHGSALPADGKILIGKRASLAIMKALGGEEKAKIDRSIVVDQKSIKNARELEGFREAHIRDGAALAQYFAWLEEALSKGEKVTESSGATKLEEYRSRLEGFKGLSFSTISSTGANAAIIHYSPDPASCPAIDPAQIYLCDSGAHFDTPGTTDVTRTWHFGQPTQEEKRAFTRVLQGHIAIDRVIFPKGSTGYILDSLARKALWEDGLDYRHGTGHGVGSWLNVHEGPQGIGTRIVFNDTTLKEGMVISNEPGYYKDGSWGVRIENLVAVRKATTPNNFGGKDFLCFEHLTLCPIQVSLIDAALLLPYEKHWMQEYHAEVLQKVGPVLEKMGDERALRWLQKECNASIA